MKGEMAAPAVVATLGRQASHHGGGIQREALRPEPVRPVPEVQQAQGISALMAV